MDRKLGGLIAVAMLLAGCDGAVLAGRTTEMQERLMAAQAANQQHPNGRFVVAGKREYSNGTEVYVLDTKSGQVCYFFATNDGKPDSRHCAGDALAMTPPAL